MGRRRERGKGGSGLPQRGLLNADQIGRGRLRLRGDRLRPFGEVGPLHPEPPAVCYPGGLVIAIDRPREAAKTTRVDAGSGISD